MNRNQIIRYSVGFAGSIVLTLAAYLLVTQSNMSGTLLTITLAVLAIAQLCVQLVCFLHLDDEVGTRWRMWSLVSMIGAVLLIVFGSIWIMYNLDYHMMPKHESDAHMIEESNKGF